jgi:hypothetical protein
VGYEPIEVARLKFEAFNDGFNGNSLAQNFSLCNEKYLIAKYYEYPTVLAKIQYSTGREAANNATTFM